MGLIAGEYLGLQVGRMRGEANAPSWTCGYVRYGKRTQSSWRRRNDGFVPTFRGGSDE